MKVSINRLNKAFESRVRLGIMSVLSVNDDIDFISLKKYLTLTDGNLATHLKALEKQKYIQIKKSFVGRKPNTCYSITKEGRAAFENHINELEKLIKTSK